MLKCARMRDLKGLRYAKLLTYLQISKCPKTVRADLRLRQANLRPERADFRPKKADLRSERANLSPERADFRPNRSPMGNT